MTQQSEATPSPSRRGLKHTTFALPATLGARSNTVPIEKGTETIANFSLREERARSNTVPIEKGTETE